MADVERGSVLRRAARMAARPLRQARHDLVATRWQPYSRLLVLRPEADWVLAEEAAILERTARSLGVETPPARVAPFVRGQGLFYMSHFALLRSSPLSTANRLGTSYFHGRPGTPGYPEFDEAYEALRLNPNRIHRVRVSNERMRTLVTGAGVDDSRVFVIPIGVDGGTFAPAAAAERAAARAELGVPASAFAVGSFQKDGVGWGEGAEPKLIKGPDVLLDTLARAHARIPDLFVLLTGPARGYVKQGLERLGIPYVHRQLDGRAEVARAYRALDAYLVTARQEGGPKAVLESMASGVPLVTTRVGQAEDLVRDGENGWMCEVEDAEGLAARLAHVYEGVGGLEGVLRTARATAEQHDLDAQAVLWRSLLAGFVEVDR
jgi:glycosyltransferase involved in cell wall biosynthesis